MSERQWPGIEVRRRRLAAKLSVRKLAALAGLDKGVIERMEKGPDHEDGSWGKAEAVEAIANALGCTPLDLEFPTAAIRGLGEPRGRSGILRPFTTANAVTADGNVIGPVTHSVIRDPTGKGGMVLNLGHSRRRPYPTSAEVVEVPGVPRGSTVLFARDKIVVYAGEDVRDVIKQGDALILDPDAQPSTGDLILVARNVDPEEDVEAGSQEGEAGVSLMVYVEIQAHGQAIPYAWPLSGLAADRVPLDGPFSIVGVITETWRPRP